MTCDCRFCQTPAQNILECVKCPVSLIGLSEIDDTTKNILLFGEPSKSKVVVNDEEFQTLFDACKRFAMSPASIYMKDKTVGVFRFDTLKTNIKWIHQPSCVEYTGIDCIMDHSPNNTSTIMKILPEIRKRLREHNVDEPNVKRRTEYTFDPLLVSVNLWTADKLMDYLRKCPRINTERFPILLDIHDEYRRLYKTSLLCEFAHADGNTVRLWMPQGFVYFTPQYHNIWKTFEKHKNNNTQDISWDDWEAIERNDMRT